MDSFQLSDCNSPDDFSKWRDTHLEVLCVQITRSHQLRDRDAQMYYAAQLGSYLARAHMISDAMRVRLAKIILNELILNAWDVELRTRWIRKLYSLVQKKPLDLQIPWRPLYDLLTNTHGRRGVNILGEDTGECDPLVGGVVMDHFLALCKLIRRLRRYFPESATEEILATVGPQLVPFDASYLRVVWLLDLFLPMNTPEVCKLAVPTFIRALTLVDRSSRAHVCVLNSLARAAKHTRGAPNAVDWAPIVPEMLAKFVQSMNLSGSSSPGFAVSNRSFRSFDFLPMGRKAAKGALSQCAAKFAVYTIGEGSPVKELLIQMFESMSTYFYPSNTGDHTRKLGAFLQNVCFHLAKRHGKESRGEIDTSDRLVLDEIKDLVECLLKIIWQAVYHKSPAMVSYAQSGLRYLAEMWPSLVLPPLLDQVYSALQDSTKSHRTLSCLRILSLVAPTLVHRRAFPQGGAHLQQLLYATLPGLDAKDVVKCNSTLSFYTQIFHNVPFISALEGDAEARDESMECDGSEEEARRATMCFEEWSVQFVDAFCRVMEHQDFKTKAATEIELNNIFGLTMSSFWSNLSLKIFKVCAKRLLNFVVNSHQTSARKFFGCAANTASHAFPKIWLEMVLPMLERKILERKSDGSVVLERGCEWHVYLLVQSMGCVGEHALHSLDKIKEIVSLCLESDEKSVRKMGRKVLTMTLRTMLSVYPLETRSFPESIWNCENVGAWKHWQAWGTYVESKRPAAGDPLAYKNDLDLEIKWHKPSKPELDASEELVRYFLKEPVELLTSVASADSTTTVSQADVLKATQTVRAVTRGGFVLFGDFTGSDCERGTEWESEVEKGSRCARVQTAKFEYTRFMTDELSGVSLRTSLTRLSHNLFERFLTTSEGCGSESDAMEVDSGVSSKEKSGEWQADSKLLKALAKLSMHLLNDHKFVRKWKNIAAYISRQVHRSWNLQSGEMCTSREVLIGRAYGIYIGRMLHHPTYTQDVTNLLGDLCRFSVHEYRSAAEKGRVLFSKCLDAFPRYTRQTASFALDVLGEADPNPKRVSGAMDLMVLPKIVSKVCHDWSLLAKCSLTLSKSDRFDDHKVQSKVVTVFATYATGMHAFPIEIPFTGHPARDEVLKKYNEEDRQRYNKLIEDLISLKGDLHWKFQLVTAVLLFFLLRKDTVPPRSLVNYFARGMLDELLPLRAVCANALECILGTHVSFPRLKLPESGFHDSNVYKWNGLPVRTEDILRYEQGPVFDASVRAELEKFFVENIEAVVSSLEKDHDQPNSLKGILDLGFSYLSAITQLPSTFPKSRFGGHSPMFRYNYASFICNLVSSFPSLVAPLTKCFSTLAAKDPGLDGRREALCTSAEIFAGVARASITWPTDQQMKFRETLGALALAEIEKCESDYIVDWESALLMICENRDPKRLQWIVTPLLAGAIDTTLDSPSSQFRKMRAVMPLLVAFAWRGRALATDLLARTSLSANDALFSAYKQVREQIGVLMFLILRAHFHTPSDGTVDVFKLYPELDSYLNALLNRVESEQMELIQQKLANSQTENSEEKENEKRKAEMKNLCESLLFIVKVAMGFGDSVFVQPLVIRVLPHIMRAQKAEDDYMSKLATTTLTSAAWSSYPADTLDFLLDTIEPVAKCAAWSAREALAQFMCDFVPRHAIVLGGKRARRVSKLVEGLLSDSKLEVRQGASKALTLIMMSTGASKRVPRLIKRFMNDSRTKLVKVKKGETDKTKLDEASRAMLTRHAGVLGLSALVHAHPYTLPDWLPPVLAFMTEFTRDPLPIGPPTKKMFNIFKQTHQDSWHEFREQFSEDELNKFNEVTGTFHYFA
eukprot:126976_1